MTDIALEVSKLKTEAVQILDRLRTQSILANSPFSTCPAISPHEEHIRLVDCLIGASLLEVADMINLTPVMEENVEKKIL